MTKIGDQLPGLEVRFTRETLVRYAGASGDFNPIHYSDHVAQALGLPGVIAHGMLTMGTALRVVTDWLGGYERLLSYSVRFTKPILVPDDRAGVLVKFGGEVVNVAEGRVSIAISAVANGIKVLGSATVEVVDD